VTHDASTLVEQRCPKSSGRSTGLWRRRISSSDEQCPCSKPPIPPYKVANVLSVLWRLSSTVNQAQSKAPDEMPMRWTLLSAAPTQVSSTVATGAHKMVEAVPETPINSLDGRSCSWRGGKTNPKSRAVGTVICCCESRGHGFYPLRARKKTLTRVGPPAREMRAHF
jgi:hypothetical protein